MSYALTLADVPPPAEAARQRPALERQVLDARRNRRLALGPNMTLLFESRLMMLWQVREMVRVEHISEPAAIQHELDTYNALLPGPRELSATLLVEFPEPAERDRALRRLVGLHQHLHLQLGDAALPVRFDEEQFSAERISSVQFVRVPLSAEARAALLDPGARAELVCDHPAYAHRASLPLVLRAALMEDLLEAERAA